AAKLLGKLPLTDRAAIIGAVRRRTLDIEVPIMILGSLNLVDGHAREHTQSNIRDGTADRSKRRKQDVKPTKRRAGIDQYRRLASLEPSRSKRRVGKCGRNRVAQDTRFLVWDQELLDEPLPLPFTHKGKAAPNLALLRLSERAHHRLIGRMRKPQDQRNAE